MLRTIKAGSQLGREILRFAQDDDGVLRMTMSDSAFLRVLACFAFSRLVRVTVGGGRGRYLPLSAS